MKKIKWGILSTGNIANQFAQGLELIDNGYAYAVCSRSLKNAKEFADKYNIEKFYDSEDEFLADSEIDAVYIGTPNAAHCQNVLSALAAGKNVLCEKPLASNFAETKKMIDAAKAADKFLMEGIWTHFFPAVIKMRSWIDEGEIGKPLRLNANFSICAQGWRLGAEQRGGAMMDLGIYCLAMTSFAFGLNPTQCLSAAEVKNGVDIAESVIMKFDADQLSAFSCALDSISPYSLTIQGEDGYIEIGPKFWCPYKTTLYQNIKGEVMETNQVDELNTPYAASGFQYEAQYVSQCLLDGIKESAAIPFEKTLRLARLMEDFRREWGVEVNT